MCGLVGVAGDLNNKDVDVFKQMLYCDVFRGSHATGIGAFNLRTSDTKVFKKAVAAWDFLQFKDADRILSPVYDCFIGHNRMGTRGANDADRNAHPFDFADVMGAHNGTINHWAVKALHDNDRYDTDSEALYSDINQNGIVDTMKKLPEDGKEGAWALTFVDKSDSTINFLRNDQRPLWYAFSKDKKALYWSSEAGLMLWILNRNGIALLDGSPTLLPVDELWSWTIPKIGQVFGDATGQPMKGAAKEPQNFYNGYPQARGGYEPWTPTKGVTPGSNVPLAIGRSNNTSSKGGTVVQFPVDLKRWRPPYKYHNGHVMTKVKFNQEMEKGCSYCDRSDVQWGKPVKFLKEDDTGTVGFLCDECLAQPDIVQLMEETYG